MLVLRTIVTGFSVVNWLAGLGRRIFGARHRLLSIILHISGVDIFTAERLMPSFTLLPLIVFFTACSTLGWAARTYVRSVQLQRAHANSYPRGRPYKLSLPSMLGPK